MFSSSSPVLNLHGEVRSMVEVLVNDFIRDNAKMQVEYVGIIHGRSSDILKTRVHEVLKQNKDVDSFKVDIFNPGITIVKIKI